METIQVGDTEVRYEVCGTGEAVICLHANPFVDWYLPLFERMPDCAFLRYSRRPLDDAPLSIAGDAATCRQLADHVGWERAHIIGHSAGALTALQLAVDEPDLVHSLCLLEPAVPSPSSDGGDTGDEDPFAPILQAHAAGDYETAMERFLVLVCGSGAQTILEHAVPGAFEQAVQACGYFFRMEVPSILQFAFTAELAGRIAAPVLNVVGERSEQGFVHGAETVQSWFPDAQRVTLSDATHLLMVEQPDAMAAALTQFFATYPISGPVGSVRRAAT